jgi:hypothetical protein
LRPTPEFKTGLCSRDTIAPLFYSTLNPQLSTLNAMRSIGSIIFALALSFSAMSQAEERLDPQGWLTYTGAWFTIKYPTNFSVVPLSKSSTSIDGYDGVKFVAAKDLVEFYIYSPQSGGLQADYTNEISAKVGSEKTETDKTQTKDYVVEGKVIETNAIIKRIIVISAKNNSYRRTFEMSEDYLNATRLIFGFRYPDKARFKNYLPSYEAFKNSLLQYAD